MKLFAAFVDGNKLERALDLVDRLHLEMSYDLAIQLAGRHDKLADSIEEAKYRRFSIENAEHHSDDDVLSEEDDKQYSPETTKFIDRLAPQISPEAGQSNKRNDRSQENAFQHVIRKKQRVT